MTLNEILEKIKKIKSEDIISSIKTNKKRIVIAIVTLVSLFVFSEISGIIKAENMFQTIKTDFTGEIKFPKKYLEAYRKISLIYVEIINNNREIKESDLKKIVALQDKVSKIKFSKKEEDKMYNHYRMYPSDFKGMEMFSVVLVGYFNNILNDKQSKLDTISHFYKDKSKSEKSKIMRKYFDEEIRCIEGVFNLKLNFEKYF